MSGVWSIDDVRARRLDEQSAPAPVPAAPPRPVPDDEDVLFGVSADRRVLQDGRVLVATLVRILPGGWTVAGWSYWYADVVSGPCTGVEVRLRAPAHLIEATS